MHSTSLLAVHRMIAGLLLLLPAIAHAVSYTYDAQDRLIGVGYSDSNGVSYSYDPAGNLLQQTSGFTNVPSGSSPNTALAITSTNATTFAFKQRGSFTVTASGNPTPRFMLSGAPNWLSIIATNGICSGTPASAGLFAFTLIASNGISPNATKAFLLTVPQAGQTISFRSIADRTYTTNPFSFTLPTASSGLPVAILLSGPAAITSNSITLSGAGTVSLVASQSGNGNYLPAPSVTNSFVVSKANQTLTSFATIPTKTLSTNPASNIISYPPPTASSGLPVTVQGTPTNLVSVSSSTLTLLGKGTVTLMASQGGNANFNAASNKVISFLVK